jgi:hypothetical protein
LSLQTRFCASSDRRFKAREKGSPGGIIEAIDDLCAHIIKYVNRFALRGYDNGAGFSHRVYDCQGGIQELLSAAASDFKVWHGARGGRVCRCLGWELRQTEEEKMDSVPQDELDSVIQSIVSHPEFLDPEYVANTYKRFCLEVIPDPFSENVITPIKRALKGQTPLSVIRIGDGEANLMTYGVYTNTVKLDHYAVKTIMNRHQGSFVVDEYWMIILRDLIIGAIAQADVIGVIGLWRPEHVTTETLIERFLGDYRGVSGQWRAVDYMLTLASKEYFNKKIIASAHLYLSVIERLDIIFPLARNIFILSRRASLVEKLQQKYSNLNFVHISVGNVESASNVLFDKPIFLSHVFEALPQDMRGCLCLIGAGPWAEIYCTWIKQRGGVGVDIGSGCDLLDGKTSRPIHEKIGLQRIQKYKL